MLERANKLQPMDKILERLLKAYGIELKVKENQALNCWSEVAGERIAQVTEPVRVEDGVMFVKVNNNVWRNEITFYKKELIQKINQKIGKAILSDIIFI